jgi:hypothetical protein
VQYYISSIVYDIHVHTYSSVLYKLGVQRYTEAVWFYFLVYKLYVYTPDRYLASSAAAIVGAGVFLSAASWIVQRPVPFIPTKNSSQRTVHRNSPGTDQKNSYKSQYKSIHIRIQKHSVMYVQQ